MRISIICAAFRFELLDRVWESVIKQTYKEWELIFVNDAQQGVRDWYKNRKEEGCFNGYDVWFIDMERQKGRFGLYTRNLGAMAANFNHVCFHDDDNQWEPNHLESLVKLEKETGKIPYCWLHVKGKKEGSTYDRVKPTGFHRQSIDLGCILYRKEFFKKYGYFQDDRQITFDFDLIEKIYNGEEKDNFVCTNLPTLIFNHKRY